jgi:hypothetical protein
MKVNWSDTYKLAFVSFFTIGEGIILYWLVTFNGYCLPILVPCYFVLFFIFAISLLSSIAIAQLCWWGIPKIRLYFGTQQVKNLKLRVFGSKENIIGIRLCNWEWRVSSKLVGTTIKYQANQESKIKWNDYRGRETHPISSIEYDLEWKYAENNFDNTGLLKFIRVRRWKCEEINFIKVNARKSEFHILSGNELEKITFLPSTHKFSLQAYSVVEKTNKPMVRKFTLVVVYEGHNKVKTMLTDEV